MDKQFVPPGHFYSPIPSREEVRSRENQIWGEKPRQLPAIDLNEPGQLALLEELKPYYADLPFPDQPRPETRYYYDNQWFGYADAILLYCMIRHLKPRQIVEIGSGYSSAVILDANDLSFGGSIECTFIEPNPDRLAALLRRDDQRHTIITDPVQDIDPAEFTHLGANDILFIDSSHVSKIGSDVNWLFFNVLPTLGADVYVHFHDVLYPFEYPKQWVYQGVAWNEAYLLRAFLQYNSVFSIQFFNSYLLSLHRDRFEAEMPRWVRDPDVGIWGGSLWLRKNRA